MKVTKLETMLLDNVAPYRGGRKWLFIKLHTDEGIVGVGEVDSSPAVAKAIIEAPLSHAIARGLRLCVLGEDPLDIARLWDRMYQGSIFYGRGGTFGPGHVRTP